MVLPIGYLFVGIGILVLILVGYLIYDHFKEKKRNAVKDINNNNQDKNPEIHN